MRYIVKVLADGSVRNTERLDDHCGATGFPTHPIC
jgi:hypothetical protein